MGPIAGPKLLSEYVKRIVPDAVEVAWTARDIAGRAALPKAGLVAALLTEIVQDPTLVVALMTPVDGEPSPGPLSTIVMAGFTPSEMVRVAAPLLVQARKARARPAVRMLIWCFIVWKV